jgi:phosphoglycolate phosphatase-like HAD superfamily hydrolase
VYKVIVFDFDGVILESLDIKTKAFLKVYDNYPEYADEISTYHLQNGGMSRYNKFIHINNNILNVPITDENIKTMASIFSKSVMEEMLQCPFVKGAFDFIRKYSLTANLYIASGTPEEELRVIVGKRSIGQYFKGVYGTPKTKAEIIQAIISSENISKDDICFVGDALTDYKESLKVGVPFIARINNDTPDNPFLKMDLNSVNDLNDLDKFLKQEF